MIDPMTVYEVATALGISYQGDDVHINTISTDSRTIQQGSVFIAIVGENFDGHDYVAEAINKGAVAVVCERPQPCLNGIFLLVDNSIMAYGKIARAHRLKFSGKVIGLTGSAGKTTTRSMLKTVLEQKLPVHSNRANDNNEIGVAKSLLELTGKEWCSVIEMGARKAGDIDWLTRIVQPDIGVITNVSEAHLETFGSLDDVACAKGELFNALADNAVAVANGDDGYGRSLVKQSNVHGYFFSMHKNDCHCYPDEIEMGFETMTFRLCLAVDGTTQSSTVSMQVTGSHNIYNACASALTASFAGCSFDEIITGLESFQPVKGRQSIVSLDGNTRLVDDSYNANPASVRAAIQMLTLDKISICFLVLADMLELGKNSAQIHKEIGRYAAESGVHMLFTYGDYASSLVDGFCQVRSGMAFAYGSHQLLAKDLEKLLSLSDRPNHVVVKGSRSMKMEK